MTIIIKGPLGCIVLTYCVRHSFCPQSEYVLLMTRMKYAYSVDTCCGAYRRPLLLDVTDYHQMAPIATSLGFSPEQ